MSIKQSITRSIGRSILQSKKQSPHIFFALGLVGVVGSAVLACRATLKLEENLDEIKKELEEIEVMKPASKDMVTKYTEEEYYKDLAYTYAKSAGRLVKLYGPSVVIGSISIVALTGSHVQMANRNAALTATLAAVSKAFDEYRIRVKEEIGEDREFELHQNIRDEAVEIEGKKEIVKISSGLSPYARFFEPSNLNWQKDQELNRIFIQCQQNYANHLLTARGHVFLNEVYDSLGLDRSQAGAVVGWVRDGDGDGYVDFNIYGVQNADFIVGNSRGALLDFNVDGVVYDKI